MKLNILPRKKKAFNEQIKQGGKGAIGAKYLRDVVDFPPWSEDISAFRVLENDEIPDGYIFGWEFRAPVIEMPLYMPRLRRSLQEMGGELKKGFVEN